MKINKFALNFQSEDTKTLDVEFNEAFIARVIPKLDWTAVVGAVADVKMDKEVPLPPKVSFLSPQLFPLNINLDIFNFKSGKLR